MKQNPSRESLINFLLPIFLILGLVLLSLNAGQNNQTTELVNPLESGLKVIVSYLVAGAEIAAAIVIGEASMRTLLSYIRQLLSRKQHFDDTELIRLLWDGYWC